MRAQRTTEILKFDHEWSIFEGQGVGLTSLVLSFRLELVDHIGN